MIELPDGPKENVFVKITQQIGEKMPVSPQDISLTKRYLVAAGLEQQGYVNKTLLCRIVRMHLDERRTGRIGDNWDLPTTLPSGLKLSELDDMEREVPLTRRPI